MLEKAEERSQFWACDLAYSKDADLILLDIRANNFGRKQNQIKIEEH